MFVQTEFNNSNKSNNNNDLSDSGASNNIDGFIFDLDVVSKFCMPICSRDNEIREVALDVISKTVEGWLDGVNSPKHGRVPTAPQGCACSADISGGNGLHDVSKECLDLVALHLPIILRLSLCCPFINIREKCQHILKIVQSRGLPVPFAAVSGPSAYIGPDELPPLGTHNEKVCELHVLQTEIEKFTKFYTADGEVLNALLNQPRLIKS